MFENGIPKGILILLKSLLPSDFDNEKLAETLNDFIREGPELLKAMRGKVESIDARLERIEDSLVPPKKLPVPKYDGEIEVVWPK